MALSFLTGSGSANNAKLFEIRLDQSIIVLRGSEQEASSALLRGSLVLCLSEPIRVGGIHLRLTGESRLSWPVVGPGSRGVKQQVEFYRHTWTFLRPGGRGRHETLPAGNYEWPFELVVPGNTPESVEGLPECWVIYRMKATIDRPRLQQNIHTRRHVRIIRTLDPIALELAHSMQVNNVWPNKVRYDINIPTKAVILGTCVNVTFNLVPLLKGLKIGKISTELCELQDFELDQVSPLNKYLSGTRLIAEDEYELPDDWPAEDIEGMEGYRFVRTLRIPMNLRECVQDVEVKGIKVRHKITFVVRLINPDTHVSELRGTLPVTIFISPNLPINEQNQVIAPDGVDPQAIQAMDQYAPPTYGDHRFDQLYSDVDPSGFVTPAGGPSGANTPQGFQSRNASNENLPTLGTGSDADFSASVLHNRLYNIQDQGSSRYARDRSATIRANSYSGDTPDEELADRQNQTESMSSSSANGRRRHITPLSRNASDEEQVTSGSLTPRVQAQHIEVNEMNEIYRLPSYGRAVRTPVRTPANEGPPAYQAALGSSSTSSLPPARSPAPERPAGNSSSTRRGRTSTSARGCFG